MRAHGGYEVFNLLAAMSLVFWLFAEPYRGDMTGFITFQEFVWGVLVIQACVLLNLVVPRRLEFLPGSTIATLHQRGRAFPILISKTNERLPAQGTLLELDGGHFRLRPRIFSRRPKVEAAVSALNAWLGPKQTATASEGDEEEVLEGAGPFLTLFDVTNVRSDTIQFRAPISSDNNGEFVVLAYVICAMTIMVLSMIAAPSVKLPLEAGDVVAIGVWSLSILFAVLFRVARPRLTAVASKGIRRRTLRGEMTCPPWSCRFKARELPYASELCPDERNILLEHCSGRYTLLDSRRYSVEQLSEFANRMNAFIWGGPTQPHDPDHPPPPPDPMFVGRKILVDD